MALWCVVLVLRVDVLGSHCFYCTHVPFCCFCETYNNNNNELLKITINSGSQINARSLLQHKSFSKHWRYYLSVTNNISNAWRNSCDCQFPVLGEIIAFSDLFIKSYCRYNLKCTYCTVFTIYNCSQHYRIGQRGTSPQSHISPTTNLVLSACF